MTKDRMSRRAKTACWIAMLSCACSSIDCAGRTLSVGMHDDAGSLPLADAADAADATDPVLAECNAPLGANDGYATVAEFDALAVGQWVRCGGEPQLTGEDLGVEFTSTDLYPLRRATDGSVQRVNTVLGPEAWTLTFDAGGHPSLTFKDASAGSITSDAPRFFDGGRKMSLTFAPWGGMYARTPQPS